MLDCFPDRIDPSGAAAKAAALAGILAEYPDEIVRLMTDPVRGMPVRQKWAPGPFEMKEACEQEFAPFRRQYERERAAEASAKLLSAPIKPPEERPSEAELKARYGEDWGIVEASHKPKIPLVETDAQLEARLKAAAAEMVITPSPELLRILDEKDSRERNYTGAP